MRGRYYEEFVVGEVIRHELSRTVTEMDNVLFSSITMNTQPLHLDEVWASGTEHGTRVVNGVYVIGLVVGISVPETVLNTSLGVLGFDGVTFSRIVRHGDTIHVETEITSARESASRPHAGLVGFEHRAFNQDDELVMTIRRVGLMLKAPAAA
ncbi:MaoC family dehydratase [Phycicoccus sp. DTK01]|uniref:MaoC family dehydratase n=1 Tax=Phycicoccus sp. DTK01 TaxID=2785745 RepID=UPI001A906E42|nr:MaoC family dehydratase [Phycicoccus sp. DTK01]GIL34125.1 MaoC family dehydratase [Phycicoccus sp. DTK01]